jgi:hypothetical protein
MSYGVEPVEACSIYYASIELAKKTLVWPHPEDLFLGGSKIQVYETLRVVSQSMERPTPALATVDIRNSTFIKEFSNGSVQGVLKRDYSMKSQHVIRSTTPNISSTIKKALREEEMTWNRVKDFFGMPKWFIQPVVAQLLHVGEVRCFLVSGNLIYKVTTTPENGATTPANRGPSRMEVTSHELMRPLHTHR